MDAMSWHGRRHIQNHSEGGDTQTHWGYPDRIVPCKNDAGSCAYLDTVYDAHDLGMLYVGIFWASMGGILLTWVFLKHLGRPAVQPAPRDVGHGGGLDKLRRTAGAVTRRYLLPDANHFVFGRTTRFQVFILAILSGYLLILTFVGIVYNTWITPVKKMPGVYNTRTSLGPWSDRVGVIAYALTPLSVMLSSRESLLSILTGVPYQSFNFLHRWLGYIIFAQSSLHTIGWCVIQIRLYQPQPSVSLDWVVQPYIIWGIVAMILLTLLFVLSTPWGIRLTGYEFFRKAHYVLAMVYIGACWAHWAKLQCFLLPSLLIWGLDRGARFVRTALLHYHPSATVNPGFSPAQATITRFPDAEHGDVLRLDFENEQDEWSIGQHFYLCFTECSIWQSHPFTPLNAPRVEGGAVKHSYILRAKSGETKKLADLAIAKQANVGEPDASLSPGPTTPVILTGPYGENTMDRITTGSNIVCVAGGTGITYVLPILLQLARQRPVPDRKVELIWAMRHSSNVDWVREEMDSLRGAQKALNLTIRLFATRDAGGSEEKIVKNGKNIADVGSSCSEDACPCDDAVSVRRIGDEGTGDNRHPDLRRLVGDFVESTISGRTVVFASGPGSMITDLRSIVSARNSASRVWRGQERFDVDLVCDDRLEW